MVTDTDRNTPLRIGNEEKERALREVSGDVSKKIDFENQIDFAQKRL